MSGQGGAEARGLARFFDWIWHIRGEVAVPDGLSREAAFERLDPLFRAGGTSRERSGDVLVFAKREAAAQDKMSIFDGGTLRIEDRAGGPVLFYHLTSRALLFCFIAPFLFLAFAQATIALGQHQKAVAAAEAKTPAGKEKAKKDAAKKAEAEKKGAAPLNVVDQWLGAPKPEAPGAKEKKEKAAAKVKADAKTKAGEKDKKEAAKKEEEEEDDSNSPTPAYVFAGIFATLYLVGRMLEAWLIRSLLTKHLRPEDEAEPESLPAH